MQDKLLHIVGCSSGLGGADVHSGDGPLTLQSSTLLTRINQQKTRLVWDKMFRAKRKADQRVDEAIADVCEDLAHEVIDVLREKNKLCVIGGDHSCAIGTWSGVAEFVKPSGDLGLIWVDAHMDSHTPETSESGNIHGMPLAHLLGFGYPTLSQILAETPKLKPENVCLIGVRSYEDGERNLLNRLNVKVYYMDEVKQRGLSEVFNEAVATVSSNTAAFGISLDIDAVDPSAAPGVDVPEKDGIHPEELLSVWREVLKDPRLIATEIVEFDPERDEKHKTEKLMVQLVEQMIE